MSWQMVDISVKGHSSSAHMRAEGEILEWTIPCASELAVGDAFEYDGKSYTVDTCEDVAHRGEVFFITTQGVKNDKSKARRARDNAGGEEV